MKKSHKVIIDMLNSGCWLSHNSRSNKTMDVKRQKPGFCTSEFISTARCSTINEMVNMGLLVLDKGGPSSCYLPAPHLRTTITKDQA